MVYKIHFSNNGATWEDDMYYLTKGKAEKAAKEILRSYKYDPQIRGDVDYWIEEIEIEDESDLEWMDPI